MDLGVILAIHVLIPITCGIGLMVLWAANLSQHHLYWLFKRFVILSLFSLLGLPASILATNSIDNILLSNQISGANTRINQISTQLNQAAPSTQGLDEYSKPADAGLLERLKQGSEQDRIHMDQPAKTLALLEQIKALDTSTFVEDIIVLCSLYLLRAFLLPILALWLAYRAGKLLLVSLTPNSPAANQTAVKISTG